MARPCGPAGGPGAGSAAAPAALTWRLLVDGAAPGARNMALDHALAECLEEGHAVLRLYRWARPTVSFGRNEPANGRYDEARGRALGMDFVRRPTGGRAVLHHREVTYTVVAPLRAFGGVRDAYRAINQGLVAGLTRLGVPAVVSGEGAVAPLDAGPCFQAPAPGEVVAGGRKLVGSAQARIGGALLQHGSVILEDDQEALAELAGGADPEARPPATVASFLDESPDPEAVAEALAEGCRLAWGGSWAEAQYHPPEIEAARRLEQARYATTEWTWRR